MLLHEGGVNLSLITLRDRSSFFNGMQNRNQQKCVIKHDLLRSNSRNLFTASLARVETQSFEP